MMKLWKSYMWTVEWRIIWRMIIAVTLRNLCSCEKKAWKNSGLYRIQTLDFCDTGAVLYQLSWQANWEQVVELHVVRYKPVKGWFWNNIMNIGKSYYLNCGVKNYLKEDHNSLYATYAVAKRKPEKIQVCTAFEPLTSVIPVQRCNN